MAVNPVDTFVRSGSYPTEIPLPFVVGRDLVGRVVHGAAGFQAGERSGAAASGTTEGKVPQQGGCCSGRGCTGCLCR